jgi:hypothetical protein
MKSLESGQGMVNSLFPRPMSASSGVPSLIFLQLIFRRLLQLPNANFLHG